MHRYILQRLLLILPTLFLILVINFVVIQLAPGGPVEQAMYQAHLQSQNNAWQYQGQQGLSPELLAQLNQQYGFDQPLLQRFWNMLCQYAQFDFGQSFFKDQAVIDLIWQRMPVTLSLGLWSTLFIYLLSIPLGIAKARRHGSWFDRGSSVLLALAYAVPAFMFALLLLVVFASASYWQWFPLQGLVSDNFASLSWWGKIKDYFWHLSLPLMAMTLSGLAALTYLTKYAFMQEMAQQYVIVARAKGLNESHVLYKHVFRNAALVFVAGLPEVLLGIVFVGNLLIEIIFNLDGIGLLGFEAIVQRDYPIIFAILLIYTLLGLILRLACDVLYAYLDPRIDFRSRRQR